MNLSDRIRLCYERAAEAKECADEMRDPEAQADFLKMERRWLLLARSYQFDESLGDFTRRTAPQLPSHHAETRPRAGRDAEYLVSLEDEWIRGHEADVASMLANTPFLLTRCSSDLRYLFVSEAYARMLGRRREEFEGRPIVEMIGQDAFRTILPYVRQVLRGEPVEYEADPDFKGSGPRRLRVRYTPDRDRSGKVQGWVGSIIDMTDQRNAENRAAGAAANEGVLQEISTLLIREGKVDALYERIVDGAIALMSADMGSLQMFDRERGGLELIAARGFHPGSSTFWKWVRLDSDSTCGKALSSGQRVIVSDVETCAFMAGSADLESYRRSGIRAVQSTPLVSRSGELLGMISTHWREPHDPPEGSLRLLDVLARQGADLIERTRAENQIVMLALEAEHRAKNLLATVQATVQLSHSDTAEGLKQSIMGRIHALANVHRLFVQSRWSGADLRTIALEELSPYRLEGEVRAQIDGASVTMKPKMAQAIAVVLHELATNAAKYGALSAGAGRVDVSWSEVPDERLILRWTETGGPPGPFRHGEGFGSRIMKNIIGSLKGDIHFDWRQDGLVCEISIPIQATDREPSLPARQSGMSFR